MSATKFSFLRRAWMLAPIVLAATACAASAAPGDVRTVGGVPFFRGDPGPIDPGTFWTSGQYKYDPDGYMDINRWDSGVHVNTVYGQHTGAPNCVFRARVVIDDWDRRHPYVRICRRSE